MRFFLLFVFVAGFMQSSAAQSKEENIQVFLKHLKENDQQKIYDISYHVDSRSNFIMNAEMRKFNVAMASKGINKYGLSPRGKWYTTQIYGGASELNIPLFNANDTTAQMTITLSFPPAAVSNKVYNLNVDVALKHTNRAFESPLRVRPGN
jgi:hypothetical protein